MRPLSSTAAATAHPDDDGVDHPPPQGDHSAEEVTDSDDNYEEVEIEIEVEEQEEEDNSVEAEEEEEVEKEVDVKEDGEELAMEADEVMKDAGQDMESKRHDGHLRSDSSTPEKSEASLPSGALAVEDNYSFKCVSPSTDLLATQNEGSCLKHEDSGHLKLEKDPVTADNGSQESAVEKKDSEALPKKKTVEISGMYSDMKAHLSNHDSMNSDGKIKQVDMQLGDDKNQMARRLFSPGIRPASLSPDHEFKDRKKRPAEICNMHSDMNAHLSNCDNMTSVGKIKQMDMQSGEDKKQMARRFSRLVSPGIRPTSLSPDPAFKDRKKRPAVICAFFAKGRCIKGRFCKFLHTKDHVNNTSQQPEGDLAAANWNSEPQLDEGSRDNCEGSRLPGFPHPVVSSVKYDAAIFSPLSSERILHWENGGSLRGNELYDKNKFSLLQREIFSFGIPPDSQRSLASKVDSGFFSSLNDAAQDFPSDEFRNYAPPINRGSSPMLRNSLLPDYGFFLRGSVLSSSNYRSGTPSSHASGLEELASSRNQNLHNDIYTSPSLSRSLNLQSSTSLSDIDMLPSNCTSARTGSSLSFSSSSLNASLAAQELLVSDKEYHTSRSASILQNSSPFSASELENLPPANPSGDLLYSAELERKFSSNVWEPSVPFRPSFFIAPAGVSSLANQSDSLRDSTKQSNLGVPFYSQGASLPNASDQWMDSDSKDEKQSIFFHESFDENVDKSCDPQGNELLTLGTEIAGTSDVDQQSGTLPKEKNPSDPANFDDTSITLKADIESDSQHQSGMAIAGTSDVDQQSGTMAKEKNPSNPANFEDTSITLKADIESDSQYQSDRAVQKKDSEVEHDMAVERKTDGNALNESKALRLFHIALVDMVKELLRPTWHDGLLSKDAHNMIVRKASDKVLSTLDPCQIPATNDSVKQYLYFSFPKIAKLVEEYVEKYGKS